MWKRAAGLIFSTSFAFPALAWADIPLLGNTTSAAIVLRALDSGADAMAPFRRISAAADSAAQTESCSLAGLDGWDDDQVNSVWTCAEGRTEYRLFHLKDGKIVSVE